MIGAAPREVIPLPHWTFGEMREAFDFSLSDYLFHGGYPGAAGMLTESAVGVHLANAVAGVAVGWVKGAQPRNFASLCRRR